MTERGTCCICISVLSFVFGLSLRVAVHFFPWAAAPSTWVLCITLLCNLLVIGAMFAFCKPSSCDASCGCIMGWLCAIFNIMIVSLAVLRCTAEAGCYSALALCACVVRQRYVSPVLANSTLFRRLDSYDVDSTPASRTLAAFRAFRNAQQRKEDMDPDSE